MRRTVSAKLNKNFGVTKISKFKFQYFCILKCAPESLHPFTVQLYVQLVKNWRRRKFMVRGLYLGYL